MAAAALEALVGSDPDDEAVAAALTTIPAAELADALRLLAREHGIAALPLLRRCLAGRPEWAAAAAGALATLPVPEVAETLAGAEGAVSTRAARTAVRRALYRLRQAGVTPPASPPATRAAPAGPVLRQGWVSAVDGTGSRGCWLVLEGPFGERTLLAAVVNETAGVLDFAAGPVAKKRLDERLRAARSESTLPWVEVPADWALHLLAEASGRHPLAGTPLPTELGRWLAILPHPASSSRPPIYGRIPPTAVEDEPSLIEGSGDLLALPELAGWFLDPSAIHSEALELLQAKESRLIVSDQIKEERRSAVVDRVIEQHFGPETRDRWRARLEETAFILVETGRATEARLAVATALALGDPERPARRLAFVRALVERSLDIAGEVALGRLPVSDVSRAPRAPARAVAE